MTQASVSCCGAGASVRAVGCRNVLKGRAILLEDARDECRRTAEVQGPLVDDEPLRPLGPEKAIPA